MKAVWNGITLAESDNTVFIEGNQYFPPESVKKKYLEKTDLQTVCHWKGVASYYNLKDGDKVAENAAWYYQSPKDGSTSKVGHEFKDYIAFYPQHVTVG